MIFLIKGFTLIFNHAHPLIMVQNFQKSVNYFQVDMKDAENNIILKAGALFETPPL